MPAPSAPYIEAAILAPDADLTDFASLAVLPSNATAAGAAWWDQVDTADGTRGRAYLDDGTRVAVDWVELGTGAAPGYVRFQRPGTMPSAGGDRVRLYPPMVANASVAAAAAYGQHAAYATGVYATYYPLNSLNDRTAGGKTLTATNGPTSGAAGLVGDAYAFAAASTQYLSATSAIASSAGGFAITALAKAATLTGISTIVSLGDSGDNTEYVRMAINDSNGKSRAQLITGAGANSSALSAVGLSAGVWGYLQNYYPASMDGCSARLDDGAEASDTGAAATFAWDTLRVGITADSTPTDPADATIQHVTVLKGEPSIAWRDHELAMYTDQAAFFPGGWTYHTGRTRSIGRTIGRTINRSI